MSLKKRSKKDLSISETKSAISTILHDIKNVIEAMPSEDPLSLKKIDQWTRKHDIYVPWPFDFKYLDDFKVPFIAPSNIVVVGSFILDTLVIESGPWLDHDTYNVDLAVEIPNQILSAVPDYLKDYKYFFIRVYFLARIALAVSVANKEWQISWSTFRGHALKPILSVSCFKNEILLNVNINPQLLFNDSMCLNLAPGSRNVSPKLLTGVLNVDSKISPLPSTLYNNLILSDSLMVHNLKTIHSMIKLNPIMREVIRLGKAWIQTRGFGRYSFHLSGFQFSMICVYLANSQKTSFSNAKEALYIFKAVLNFLASLDSNSDDQSSTTYCIKSGKAFKGSSFKDSPVVLLEPSAKANILFDWTVETLMQIKREAQLSIAILNDPHTPSFSVLFTQPEWPPSIKYDRFFVIRGFDWHPDVSANWAHYYSSLYPEMARLKMIGRKLMYGLGSRLVAGSSPAINVVRPKKMSVFILKSIPEEYHSCIEPTNNLTKTTNYFTSIEIGFLMDHIASLRTVEAGPSVDSLESIVKTFRLFWRSRTHARRFKDGSIVQTVAWENMEDSPYLIVPDILDFIFREHFSCKDRALGLCPLPLAKLNESKSHKLLTETCTKLGNLFRNLNGIPLPIVRVEAIGPAASQCLPFSPLYMLEQSIFSTSALPPFCPVTEVLLHLESSSKWPQDYYGFIFAEQAFLEAISRRLKIEAGVSISLTTEFFDVQLPESPFVFRCRLYLPGKILLMHNNGMDTTELVMIQDKMTAHYRAMNALLGFNPLFAPSTRLFKRWISGLMLTRQFNDQICELLMAAVFLDPHRTPINSSTTALTRMLYLISFFDWTNHCLMVDFSRVQGEAVRDNVGFGRKKWSPTEDDKKFKSSCPMKISPSYESDFLSYWSLNSQINDADLKFLIGSAKQTLSIIGKIGTTGSLSFDSIFSPPKSDIEARFDFVATIQPWANNLLNCSGNYESQLDANVGYTAFKGRKKLLRDLESAVNDKCGGAVDCAALLESLPGFDPISCLIGDLIKELPSSVCIYHGPWGSRPEVIGFIIDEDSKDLARVKFVEDKARAIACDLLI